MERWSGRVALVTGANSGVGAAIAKALMGAGMKVVGADINVDAMQKMSSEKESKTAGSLTAVKCDLTVDKDIEDLFKFIKDEFGGVDVCVNNAGILFDAPLLDGSPSEWRKTMDVNVIALCYCSKLATASMVERGITDGLIFNLCSIASHLTKVPAVLNFYSATKHAVKFLTEGLRQEMIEKKYNIRVGSISPALVRTQIFSECDPKIKEEYIKPPILSPDDIAKGLLYFLSSPPEVEINDVIIRPLGSVF